MDKSIEKSGFFFDSLNTPTLEVVGSNPVSRTKALSQNSKKSYREVTPQSYVRDCGKDSSNKPLGRQKSGKPSREYRKLAALPDGFFQCSVTGKSIAPQGSPWEP